MADKDQLADVFGEDFVEQYEDKVNERRRQRESVSEETKKEIANQAVNEDRMNEGEEPRFTFTTDEGITHDVILVTLPDPGSKPIWSHMNELESGAVTIPLDYLGEWMSCLFNDPEDLKSMEPGETYILIGKMDTWQPEDGQPQDQMSPVRGVMDLETLNEYAREKLSESGINDPTEEEPEEEEEDESSSSGFGSSDSDDDEEEDEESSGGFLSGGGDEDEEEEDEEVDVDKSDVEAVIEKTADDHPEIWEVEGEGARLDKVGKLVATKSGYDEDDEVALDQIKQYSLEVINDHNEDDEDEEESLF